MRKLGGVFGGMFGGGIGMQVDNGFLIVLGLAALGAALGVALTWRKT